LDIESMTVEIEGQQISQETQSYGPVTVIICKSENKSPNGRTYVQLADELNIGLISIKPPQNTERMEKYIILLFSTAIYFITYRVFASKMYVCAPYVYKFDELWNQTLTTDYDIISVNNYSNLISRVGRLVDRSIAFEWEGRIDECPRLLPYMFLDVGGQYVISNITFTIDGEYVKISGTADNRHILYQRWSKITSDVVPQKCGIEIYPRIPNRHYPTSKIYAYSDRDIKVYEYLKKVFDYTYTN